jgi:hypothetical protein
MIPELKKLPPIEGFFVNNSVDFCEKLEHQTIADDKIMVSFDASNRPSNEIHGRL